MNHWRKISFYLFFVTLIAWCGNASSQTAPAPQRVVSLAPSVTETIFALGYGNRLVGVTTYCDYPAEARKLPKIGGFTNPSLEAIVAKRPDLVIGVNAASDPVTVREIERVGIRVVLLTVNSVNDILNSIRSIAGLLGNPAAGEKLVNKISLQIERVKQAVNGAPRRATLLAVGIQPLVAVGGRNFIDELITLAGGENIAGNAAQPWLNLPDEYVVAKAPQVIIEAGMGSDRGRVTRNWSDLKSIPAVKEQRIYAYPSDKILRPGPRIGDGLEEIAHLVHPECFRESKRAFSKGSVCESSRP